MCNELTQTRQRSGASSHSVPTQDDVRPHHCVACALFLVKDFEAMEAAMLEVVLHERDDLMLEGAMEPGYWNLNITVARLNAL